MDNNELQRIQVAIQDLLEKERYEDALPIINQVLEFLPNNAATLNFLGYTWLMGEKPAIAYQFFRRALQENPGNKSLWCNLGRAAHDLGNYEEAIKYFLKSAELDNNYAMAYSNGAASLVHTSQWKDAEESCKLALEIDPNDKNAQMNLAHAYLAQGRWDEGWNQWGLSLGGRFRKEWHYGEETRWDGSPDKVLIVYGEQGLGDEIFYASCLPDAINISKKVYIDCDPRLEGLFKRSFPNAEVHGTRREEHPKWIADKLFHHRCALGGLPEFFRHDNKDFPGTSYLVADPERRKMWRALFDSWGKKVIGITTQGGIKHTNEAGRKLTQEDLQPLLKRDDIVLVSLDYKVDKQIEGVKYFPFATQSKDYDDTAALIAELDAVVGVNTTAQHCAAALGVRTICLVPKWHQWRYAQKSMPWYRSMQLIYQDHRPWLQVIQQVNGWV